MRGKIKKGQPVSIIITTFNEETNIGKLLIVLNKQMENIAGEIIMVDAGSSDKTVNIAKKFVSSLYVRRGISRAAGRNVGVRFAKNDVIVMTDAGCIPHKDWLRKITGPLYDSEIDIVAGFYSMEVNTPFQKAAAVFMGVLPQDFNETFLPSTRSIAFRKDVWKKVGGFPEELKDTAEDTVFNYKAIKVAAKIVRVKNATVRWGILNSFFEVLKKMYKYAKGDAQSKIFWNPGQGFSSHNLKVLLIFIRYLLGLFLLVFSTRFPHLLPIIIFLICLYIFWSFAKVFSKTKNWRAGLWGIPLQAASDFAVTTGFLRGFLDTQSFCKILF